MGFYFRRLGIFLGACLLLSVSACTPAKSAQNAVRADTSKRLSVYASCYPMYDFTAKLGGDKIQLQMLVQEGSEPHDWEPSASDMAKLQKADLLVYNGAGLEHWVDDLKDSLKNSSLKWVEASSEINLLDSKEPNAPAQEENVSLEDPSLEEANGHFHTHSMDPHVWLDPLLAKQQLRTIAQALESADSANAAYYQENLKQVSQELDRLDQEYRQALSKTQRKDLIVSHQAFGYLCARYGLEQIAIEGLSPHSEPEPSRMAAIIELAKERKAHTIFFEDPIAPKTAQAIAQATGASTDFLSPIESRSHAQASQDYFSLMRENLSALVRALQ